ncbi:Thyroid adenoma-associated protein like [Pseudolycoriella hygida]|uniref:tRNA (32-2'-O)-methyltransferase regulator THADA n=1 Tax=Pseudolycoriella hygida TaxID=35572 RepID=A0A9Q0N9U0_9DIPT|nr:Thyroid adenoma-associated protein like [Pseudolycoriella hygida]
MNGLSLRVSSIKTSQNLKKNSEIQISILKLSDIYLNRISDYFVNEPEVHSYLTEFKDGKSVEQQVVSARKLLVRLENELPSSELSRQILDLLSEIYFTAPLKHSLRKIIARSFDKMKMDQCSIIESLVETVTRNLKEITHSSCVDAVNTAIISVDGLTENFRIGTLAVYQCVDEVCRILTMSIVKYLVEIEKRNSPANLSEIFIFLHNSVKLLLSYINRCVSDSSLTKASELAELSKFCKQIIDCDVVPMDTKLNCGIFLVLEEIVKGQMQELCNQLIAEKGIDELALCYCYGLCNTLESSNLFNERPSLLIEVIEILRTIANENINEQTMLLGVTRALSQMTKSLSTLSFADSLEESSLERKTKTAVVTNLVEMCLSFVWSYIEHHLNTVRHFCKEIFRNLLKLSHRPDRDYTFILSAVLSTIMRQEMSLKVQYIAIECLCQEMQVEDILTAWPTIFEDLFEDLEDLEDPQWVYCYQKIMSIHCQEIDVQSWLQMWIRPLLGNFGKKMSLQTMESLISVAIKSHPMVPGYFLQEKDNLPLELYLFVVSIIRSNKLQSGLHFVPAEDKRICGAKFHYTDEIRIMHLRIFVEVQKTTQPFTAADLNEILEFLRYNSNCQSPSFRQKIISFMTIAFNRIEASYPSVVKDPSKVTLISYLKFLSDVKCLCLSNICNGANFSRRAISLNVLLRTLTVSTKNGKISPDEIWTEELFEKLLQSLNDTYEANKALAVNIIRLCPTALVPKSPNFDLHFLKKLVTSVKPIDCVTAAHYLEYCCITGINFSSYLDAIIWCKQILVDGLKVAQSSLLIAARSNPLYGLVFCIKHLMSRVDLMKTCDEDWRNFIQELIGICKSLTEVVAPIVNNSSPEGHLPNDFSDVDDILSNETDETDAVCSSRCLQNENNDCLSTTPQMLLLCSWRTVKEVSILLGNLVLNAATVTDSNRGVITIDEILEIGNLFHILLSETKHRGAFEQAFIGFSKLCVRLWRANEPRLHQLPMVWLKDLLNIISGNDSSSVTHLKFDKICATRRSAGVPFMIQAILTSELLVCTSNGLKCSMVSLFDICRNGSVPEGRTHALNILRLLFRCTHLGDSVGEYISDGIECAIRGYSADNWPERNSSTLLFSSLITRVFGVQRTKDSENLNIRNKMTGRIFFLKYPRLFDFFLQELQAASLSIQNDQVPPTLHPLLILLSRLYPSAVDGCTSNLKLSLFLPLIGQCSFSPESETRKLAVRSIVALVPKHELFDYVHKTVHQILQRNVTKYVNSNALHGSLLQIYHLIKSVDHKLFTKHLDDFVSLTRTYLNLSILSSNNFVIIKVYVDTIIEIFTRISKVSDENIFINERSASFNIINEFICSTFTNSHNAIGFPLALKSCLVLHLIMNVSNIESLNFLQDLPLKPYEYVDAALTIILLVLHHTSPEIIFERFECDRNELQFLEHLPFHIKQSFRQAIIRSQQLISHLNGIIDDEAKFYPFCTVKAYNVLSELNLSAMSDGELTEVIERRTVDQIDEVKASIVTYASNHLGTMSEENVVRILRKLRELAAPDGSEELRISISVIISKLQGQLSSPTSLLLFGDIMLLLLRDESSEIRETISQVIQSLQKDRIDCAFTVLPSLAEEKFIDWLDEQFGQWNIENRWTMWIQLIQMQMDKSSTESEEVVDEVFEKCESNVFGEVVLLCKKLLNKLRESLSNLDRNYVKETLNSIQSDWPELFE